MRICTRSTAVIDWQAVRDRQRQYAQEAVELVAADIGASTRLPPPSWEFRIEEDRAIRAAYWGQFATMTLMGVTRDEVLVEVADFRQDEVIEDLHSPWPSARCMTRAATHSSSIASRSGSVGSEATPSPR